MPWSEDDVHEHNHAASEDETKRRQWVSVANHTLNETGDDARAIRTANAAVADDTGHTETVEHPHEQATEGETTTVPERKGMRRPSWRWAK